MAVFQTEQEVYEIVGEFFETVADSEEAKAIAETAAEQMGEQYDAIVQFVYHKPESRITWCIATEGSGRHLDVIFGETDRKPELVFEMNGDIAHKYWLGKIDLAQALARQQMKATGPLSKALKVIPHLEKWYPRYAEYLRNNGREHLVD